MTDDPAVEEIRRIKERHAAKYGYDIDKMVRALKRREAKCGHKVVSFAPKQASKQAGGR